MGWTILISIGFLALALWLLPMTGRSITEKIIDLYERLEGILIYMNEDSEVLHLNFNETAKELNDLNLTFNMVVKTLNLVKTMKSIYEEDEGKQVMKYTDAFNVFEYF